MWKFLSGLVLALAVAPVFAQEAEQKEPPQPQNQRRSLGVQIEVGAFIPTDSEIRDRFGDVLYRVGVRPESGRRGGNWRTTFDLSAISADRRGNRMFILPASLALVKGLGDPRRGEAGYVQIGAGPAYMDYAINRLSEDQLSRVRVASKRVGFGAHVELGYSIGDRLTLTARYDWLSEADEFQFGGASISVAYTVFRL